MNKTKYTFNFIKITGFENDFDVLNKWLNNQEQGEYRLTVERFTGEKKNGKIEITKPDDK